jgi:hypothetical protein
MTDTIPKVYGEDSFLRSKYTLSQIVSFYGTQYFIYCNLSFSYDIIEKSIPKWITMIQIRDFLLIRAHVLIRLWCTDFVILTSISFADISYCSWYLNCHETSSNHSCVSENLVHLGHGDTSLVGVLVTIVRNTLPLSSRI